MDVSQLNTFLTTATNAITCGAECQRQKKTQQLKDKLAQAEANIQLAVPQLELAKQNYLTYVSGEDGYNNVKEEEYKQQAEALARHVQSELTQRQTEIQTLLETYHGLFINYQNVLDLYLQYKSENKRLFETWREEANDVLTNERKTYYEDLQIGTLNGFYYVLLLILYGVAVVMYSFFLATSTNANATVATKLMTVLGLVLLPFVSTWMLSKVVFVLYWIYTLLPKNVYR